MVFKGVEVTRIEANRIKLKGGNKEVNYRMKWTRVKTDLDEVGFFN